MTSASFVPLGCLGTPAFRLFCVPYAGAGVATFHGWASALPAGVEVCAAQLPGRDALHRLPPFNDVRPLVDALARALGPLLDLPFALYGHSMGGLVILELARALRRGGWPAPSHFLVSSCRAPGVHQRSTRLHRLPDDEFLAELRARYGGVPDLILQNPELLAMFLPALRADLTIVETYADHGGAPFDFPITAMGGLEDREVSRADLDDWRRQTTRAFRLHMVAGDHFFLNTDRAAFLGLLREELAGLVPGPRNG